MTDPIYDPAIQALEARLLENQTALDEKSDARDSAINTVDGLTAELRNLTSERETIKGALSALKESIPHNVFDPEEG